MSEPPTPLAGDPWIDAYLAFRQAWVDGGSADELQGLAKELRAGLPCPAPPMGPVAMFIQRDIEIVCGRHRLPSELVTALWVPSERRTR